MPPKVCRLTNAFVDAVATATAPSLRRGALVAALAATAGCFGIIREPARHYFVLNLQPENRSGEVHVDGLLRVRDLDTESIYDRLNMVVRRSPYELAFRPRDTWAVKPGRMVSDALAHALVAQQTFTGITRELSERRPDYLMAGNLHRLEVDENGGRWQARLGMTLQVSGVGDGKILWTHLFDLQAPIAAHDYAAGVRALSDLLAQAADTTATELSRLTAPPAEGAPTGAAATDP